MPHPAGEHVYSVSELNRQVRLLLEQDLPPMWISGEISNLARPGSGHLYFSLKDERAQIRCAMFRGANRGLNFIPANGQQVLVRGRISLYEPRGDYQLIVEHMEAAGEGALRRRLEELKQKLAAEGLFATEHKKPLPPLPRRIGVITSASGAAIRDVLHILRRRFPAIPVVLYPVQVQGEQAKFDIVRALETATRRAECDVLILARGGGSLEDLWAFNEEIVARALYACPLPVISGVGHEIDVTIADFVADVRAPTPSGAAELAVPDSTEWLRRLQVLERRAGLAAEGLLHRQMTHWTQLEGRLQRCHPGYFLGQNAQRLDELRARLMRAIGARLELDRLRTTHALSRLRQASPASRLLRTRERADRARQRLGTAAATALRLPAHRLAVVCGRLQAVSPLATLERGYAIVQDGGGRVVRRAAALSPGDAITARVAEGIIDATVKKIHP